MSLVEFKGKPIEKLIDVISTGIGVLYTPRRIRKEAKAEAERSLILAEAKAKKLLIMNDAENELARRAGQRIVHQELNRQKNIEEIADKVLNYLGESVSEISPEKDWSDRFFNRAQDVSNEELQDVWAKILAEELTSPGKTHLKTLDVLSNLGKTEAIYFNTACSLALNDGRLPELRLNEYGQRYYGMPYSQILDLIEAGLIHHGSLTMNYNFIPVFNGCVMFFGNSVVLCKTNQSAPLEVHHLSFTKAGIQLMNVLKPEKDERQLNQIAESITSKGIETRVSASNKIIPF